MSEGAKVWLIPDGYLPERSIGEQQSHEAVCVLNTSADDAHIKINVYFEDRDAIHDIAVIVPAERTLHIRLDKPEMLGGVTMPRGIPYALRVESDIEVCVQHSRLDTSQEALALFTTVAHAVR